MSPPMGWLIAVIVIIVVVGVLMFAGKGRESVDRDPDLQRLKHDLNKPPPPSLF